MLYVLSVFMTSLAMWCDDRPRWAVRRHSAAERECSFRLWCVIGAQMRIPGISSWACFDDAVAFRLAYEAAHSRPAATNSAITASTVDFFAAASPGFIRPGLTRVMLRVVSALQASSKHVEAMGLPPPGVAVPLALDALLTLRADASSDGRVAAAAADARVHAAQGDGGARAPPPHGLPVRPAELAVAAELRQQNVHQRDGVHRGEPGLVRREKRCARRRACLCRQNAARRMRPTRSLGRRAVR